MEKRKSIKNHLDRNKKRRRMGKEDKYITERYFTVVEPLRTFVKRQNAQIRLPTKCERSRRFRRR